ncbi:diacylglycerol kinase delta-like isoform X4 [Echeneis naucrates]|nr:diacylglycerol kinase delta-like isoform X4 [Echeneis naucrates]XP_029372872.1 diacylglycerol kinase delta-like isoform X4 [Echeneis naucrates]XP_029372873.1 diacylglycerol kinase delta-like isoform X4 [Echeneis naucrates]XP_029372874.1 diacylglycerol kinase delta-like isoform X4 [Echeneis naucrates]
MEEWMAALRSVQNRQNYESTQYSMDHFSGMHNWYACSHARPTYCNVCREALSGVTSHGLSCEVCKFKAHKRCAVRATNNCKWTTLASIGRDIIEDEDGVSMPHQWLEGNLPVSAKCNVCDKTCGSVLRLQDWRCLWCKAMVHSSCKEQLSSKCPLGQCKVSVIPPTALNSIDSDGFWKASCPPSCTSPLLVFVNSKSGDNQGVKFLRRFKQLLNPAQVFDLMNGGPHLGLRLFQKFDTFRILVCGGDGSVGWVLSEIDALMLHKQCQLGVLPLGTGNDLARVLGWGSACDDDTQLPQILEKLERASTKMLDRWSIMVYETKFPRQHSASTVTEDCSDDSEVQQILTYEDSVAAHLSKILTSDQHSVVISSAKVLCETVKDFVARVGKAYEKNTESSEESEAMAKKCGVLKEKLDSLLKTLNEESQASTVLPTVPPPTIAEEQEEVEGVTLAPPVHHPLTPLHVHTTTSSTTCPRTSTTSTPATAIFKPREQLMLRANSLKKAIRQIIEQTEKAVDEQNAQTQQHQVFSLSRAEEEDGLVEEEEEEDLEEDKMSLHSSYSAKHRNACRVSKTPCEKLINKGSLSLGSPVSLPVQTGSRENMPMLNTKILYPGLRAGISGSLSSSSVISRLLVNADPFNCDPDNMDCYTEKCVMNNYFGIGLDAKISLDFNNKRDEHPEKCRSRTKNMMWYGVLGTKELLHRTYKNLEQRVLLECDGRPIPLPSLQGIAVLNIPSYAGGTNFWGGTKEDDTFTAPSFDDKILEVVAVFGSMQMAVSRVINLQHHRIAQCRTVKITILGDEGVPVQVDGEAWIQSPGYIQIIHKNRTQTLTRDRAFESTLKSWEDKQKCEFPRTPPPQPSQPALAFQPEIISEEEASLVRVFGQAAGALIHSIREVAQSHHSMEQELAHAVNASSKAMDIVYANSKSSGGFSCSVVVQMVSNVKALLSETELLLAGKMSMQLDPPQQEQLNAALNSVAQQLRRLADVPWLCPIIDPSDHEGPLTDFSKRSRSAKFRLVPKFKKDKNNKNKEMCATHSLPVNQWGTEEVGAWLDFLCLTEYKDIFIGHDVRGAELIHLERRDLKDLGVTKVGHMKRILQGIRELNRNSSASEA